LSHQRGTKTKTKQNKARQHKAKNKTKQKKKPRKCPKFKRNTVSVSFSACRCSSVVFSLKVGREKKKESGDSAVNGYLRLWVACPLLSACCCWRLIYADLRGELSTHLALQALFTQSSSVHKLLLQAFHSPSTPGEVTLHLLSQACMFIYSSHGKWVLLPLLWSFPPTAAFTSFPRS
jgi:hypothetical protein